MKTSKEIFETLYASYPALVPCRAGIEKAYTALLDCARAEGTVLVCGNGGSAADSEHIVGELMKGFNLKRPLTPEEKALFTGVSGGEEIADKLQRGIRAVSLVSQSGLITAFSNDIDPELIFAQQVFAYAQKKEDVLIALSTSGNSKNVVNAASTAKAAGIRSIAITGEKDSRLSAVSDVTVRLPAQTPFEVQELTLPVYHALCAAIEADMFDK